MLLIAVLLSLLVGVSLGLLGGGGSILTVPILRYVLGMPAHEAIAASLLVVGSTSLGALIAHARAGRIKWRTGFIFGLAGMSGAFLAGRIAHRIPAAVLLFGFGAMMIATAIAMLRTPARRPSPSQADSPSDANRELPIIKVVVEGLAVGAVTGLVGAGGGFLVVPALVLLGGMPIELAIGTSLLVIAMKSFAGLAGYLGHTALDLSLALPVTASALLGSLAGGALSSRIRPQMLRQGFGWFVVAMAFFIFAQELPPLFHTPPRLGLAVGGSLLATALIASVRSLLARRARVERPVVPHGTVQATPLANRKALTEQLGGRPS